MERPIAALLQTLRRIEPEAGVQEVADWIWLAAQLEKKQQTSQSLLPDIPPPEPPSIAGPSASPTEPLEPLPKDAHGSPKFDTKPERNETPADPKRAELHTTATQQDHSGQGIPFSTPGGRALPRPLEIARALRPLMRRVAAPELPPQLDEEASIRRIIDNELWLPVFCPVTRPWLDLALVVDEAPSMRIWQRTIHELRLLLSQLGAFRDVRSWRLRTSARDREVSLHAYGRQLARSHKELLSPARSRLILLVSDCASPAWQGEMLLGWLRDWGKHHPVGLLQILPDQRLWSRGRLGQATRWAVSALSPAAPNLELHRRLLSEEAPRRAEEKSPLMSPPLPMTTLVPERIKAWAGFVAGSYAGEVPAFVLRAARNQDVAPRPPDINWETRYNAFHANASRPARKLASLFAAAPLRLPVMRLVQQVMLPQSDQTHLAEFFLSGLIKRVSPSAADGEDSEQIDYDFLTPDLRQRLLSDGQIADAVQVQIQVGDYISRHLGGPNRFLAALAGEHLTNGLAVKVGEAKDARFAYVTDEVLNWLGVPLTTQPAVDEDLKNGVDKKPESIQPDDTTDFRFDIKALPAIRPEQFVGRLQSKNALLDAIEDDAVSIFGIIADGGVGKATLVYECLREIIKRQPHVTNRIYAWSFSDAATYKLEAMSKIQGSESEIEFATSNSFFVDIFKFFNVSNNRQDINIGITRPEPLIAKMRYYKSIIVLDSLEGLQSTDEPNRGKIMSDTITAFLEHFLFPTTHQRGSLVIITSRLPLPELVNAPGYKQLNLKNLTPSSGGELLSKVGVRGPRLELEQASEDYGGHSLSLVLLGKVISNKFSDRHIKNRFMINDILLTVEIQEYHHIKQVQSIIKFYHKVISEKEEIIIMQMMGLFHSPMSDHQRDYLVRHAKFASPLRHASPEDWNIFANKLERYGLLNPHHEYDPQSEYDTQSREIWNCHPLAREYFRNLLKERSEQNQDGYWEDAHYVLFIYFSSIIGIPNSLDELIPIYRAIYHGCLAGEYEKSLNLYRTRVLRNEAQGYSTNRLGAASQDVACLMGFLTERAQIALGEETYSWVQARMAFCQTCRGHLTDALMYRNHQLEFAGKRNNILELSRAHEELSSLYLFLGNLPEAKKSAESALTSAHTTGDISQQIKAHCRFGAISYFRGDTDTAIQHFTDACKRQAQLMGPPTLLYDHGFYFRLCLLDMVLPGAIRKQRDHHNCQELIDNLTYENILDDANKAIPQEQSWLAAIGLDQLIKAICLSRMGKRDSAEVVFEEARKTLIESGFVIYLAYYFNLFAEFQLSQGKIDLAATVLKRAKNISSDYGLPLVKIDSYIIDTRLLLSKLQPGENAESIDRSLKQAENLISNTGYSYRTLDIELLRGELALLQKSLTAGMVKSLEQRIDSTRRNSLLSRWNKLNTAIAALSSW